MITEKTLRRWRKDALQEREATIHSGQAERHPQWLELQERVIRLTQELMDLHLIRKG